MKHFGKSSRERSQGVPKIFREPIYGEHCAVVFAIVQLSCLLSTGTYDVLIFIRFKTLKCLLHCDVVLS